MPHHPVRNQVIAGAFVLAMLVVAIAVLVVLGGRQSWFEARQVVRVHFRAAPNLKVGNPVLMAGHPVGRVRDIRLVEVTCPPEERPQRMCYRVEVLAELPSRYTLYKNAQVAMIQSLVGQSAVVNIRDVGFGAALGAGAVLTGRQESPFADAADELGIGEKEKVSIQEILENIRGLTADAKRDAPEILAKLKTTSANLEEASGKVKGTLKTVQDILDENRPDVRDAVANARDLAEQANDDGKAILARTKDATETAAAILDENRPDVRETIARARSVAEKADKNVDDILENAKAGAKSLKDALADLRVMTGDSKDVVVWNKGNLNKILLNFTATSADLKALAHEVRRAPWRLFATPDKKEVESLNLYDAARQFASAASDLEGLADTLKVMLEAQEKGVAVDPQILQGMVDRLQDTFNHYQATEEALWKEFDRIKK